MRTDFGSRAILYPWYGLQLHNLAKQLMPTKSWLTIITILAYIHAYYIPRSQINNRCVLRFWSCLAITGSNQTGRNSLNKKQRWFTRISRPVRRPTAVNWCKRRTPSRATWVVTLVWAGPHSGTHASCPRRKICHSTHVKIRGRVQRALCLLVVEANIPLARHP